MQLYKLTNQMLEIQESGMSPDDIADTLEGMEMEFNDKVEQTLSLIKNLAAEAESFKAESERLKLIADSKNKQVDGIKQYLKGEMVRLDYKKISVGLHQLSVRAPLKKLNVINSDKIPPEWIDVKVIQKPKAKDILKALKEGEKIPGVEIILGESSLQIK